MTKKLNKPRLFRNVILIILVLGCIGLYFSNRFVKSKGFEGLGDFIDTYQTNKKLAENIEPELIELNISDKDYKFLEKKRQEALNRGIQINKGDNYIKCEVIHGADTLDGEMRLKGHMTDHLEGDKWSFRVKTDGEIMGMYRFSLQNPATRNYAYEWVYHQLLEREDIMHLKYDFIKLKLNDKDLGVYAIEEHFGQHVSRDNNRPPGVILRWNPELYWESRRDEMDSLYLDQEYAAYTSSFPEAYDRGVAKDDPNLIENYRTGAAMLESFRRGERSVSNVFDIEKMAAFHAVIDLVGGYHSLDWSDVKFFYNQETQRIEPVGYESFSVRESYSIAGQRRPNDYESIGQNYHDMLFADTSFFSSYIRAIDRICDEAYMREFEELVKPELNKKRGVLAEEFSYIKFTWGGYYENIELIRHNLELPKPFHAFLETENDSIVKIAVAPVSDFPIEILGLVMNKKEYAPVKKIVLGPKPANTFLHYDFLQFKHNDAKIKDLILMARIPGSKHVFKVNVSELPSYMNAELPNPNQFRDSSGSKLQWANDTLAFFEGRAISITSQITIPSGKTLHIYKGQRINFERNGQLFVEGNVELFGSVSNPVEISASTERTAIYLSQGSFLAVHTSFLNIHHSLIRSNEGVLKFDNCVMADINSPLIKATLSNLTIINSYSGNMSSLGEFDRSVIRVRNFYAVNGDQLLTASGSDIDVHASSISGYGQIANLDHGTSFSTWTSKFEQNNLLADLKNASSFKTYSCSIISGDYGVHKDTLGPLGQYSNFLFYKTQTVNLKSIQKTG